LNQFPWAIATPNRTLIPNEVQYFQVAHEKSSLSEKSQAWASSRADGFAPDFGVIWSLWQA
jgi:hypothetical protein